MTTFGIITAIVLINLTVAVCALIQGAWEDEEIKRYYEGLR